VSPTRRYQLQLANLLKLQTLAELAFADGLQSCFTVSKL
jgi:hypothetical protein